MADLVDTLEPRPRLAELFEVHDLPGSHRAGPFQVDSVALPHHVPDAGVRLTTPSSTLAYTGDTGPDPALAELGANADLYIMEATLRAEPEPGEPRKLLTAREAGRWARAAGARRLLLTHFWPGADRAESVRQAGEEFAGEILAAEEDLVVQLQSPSTTLT